MEGEKEIDYKTLAWSRELDKKWLAEKIKELQATIEYKNREIKKLEVFEKRIKYFRFSDLLLERITTKSVLIRRLKSAGIRTIGDLEIFSRKDLESLPDVTEKNICTLYEAIQKVKYQWKG